ncbi:hypothetical protein CPLU01_03571 [Colletotrichum plurivorum]|uniref:Uncharacterized protein n=1 Tax=Colletotrichum plurivorum TaxID=2175906 RepID=A0A8H6NL73_9PEZI|nr:hypothetical protein CPLU01_03571 [Colletotrichum plurivorum]
MLQITFWRSRSDEVRPDSTTSGAKPRSPDNVTTGTGPTCLTRRDETVSFLECHPGAAVEVTPGFRPAFGGRYDP